MTKRIIGNMRINNLSYPIFVILVLAAGVLLYVMGYVTGFFTEWPTAKNLVQWDAAWYQSIVEQGYFYLPDEQSNAGFFPGFPMLWKVIGGGSILISVINTVLFFTGIYLLKKCTRATNEKLLFLITLPSALFFFVPYSEALFFLFGVGILYSWERKESKVILFMAILAALVRPVFFFLLPAIILTYILTFNKGDFENSWKRYALLFVGVIIGAVIGFGIIGWYTGDFFAYSKSQVEQWNHAIGWPSLPFTTWRGARMLWLDGLGLFVVVLALIALVRMVYLRFVKFVPMHLSAMEIMSMGYLVMILVYVLFFHPEEDGRTSLLSMHRYVFCSPFFYFLLLKNMNRYSVNRFTLRILLAALLITLLAIGFPTSELLNWSYTIVLFYLAVMLFFVVQSLVLFRSAWSLPVIMMISIVNLLLQLYLFHSFLNGNWVG